LTPRYVSKWWGYVIRSPLQLLSVYGRLFLNTGGVSPTDTLYTQ
jgi:hypothetical protein